MQSYYDEGAKETLKKGFKKAADGYYNALNTSSEKIAKKIVKKPEEGSDASVYKEYKRKLERWKATIKVGEFLATGAIAVGPFDIVLKALAIVGMKDSRDPADRLIKSKIQSAMNIRNKLSTALNNFKNKVKSKTLKESDFKKEVSLLDSIASAGAKQCDDIKNGKEMKPAMVKEYADNIDIIYDENGEVSYEMFEYVNELVECTDFTDGDDVLILEAYLDVLIKSLE